MGLIERVSGRFSEISIEQTYNFAILRSYLDHSLVSRKDVHWLFILTLPNGGSTALAKLLLSSPSTTALNGNAEGQWLIPSLRKPGARWDPDNRIPKRRIRAVWLNCVKNRGRYPILVIEKSPPNLCRYRDIVDAFKTMKTYVITLTRDPYATCASWHKRYGFRKIVEQWSPPGAACVKNESDYFRFLGKIWLQRATMLLDAREHSILNLSYEEFTENTFKVISELGALIPQLRDVSPTAKVKVKDYDQQEIVNMNNIQIGTLSNDQIAAISSALREDVDTVEKLGYSIR